MGFSCSGGSGGEPDAGASKRDGQVAGETAPSSTVWQFFDVPECGQQAGYQTVAAASGSKVAFATLSPTNGQAPCAIEGRTGTTAPVYDICVVLPSASGFVGTIATSQPYAAMMGVGLAFDKTGEPVLAYTGGPSANLRCGASDLMLASVSGGTLGTPRDIAANSQSSGMPPDQAVNCAAQDVCNKGDATGYWPALARDPASGNLAVAFRDLHFGFADTDFASSDVEFARGDAYSIFTADVARGGGTYMRLGFSPAGKAAIVHYSLDYQPAIWLDHETDQGWESKKLFVGTIHEQLGFAVSSQGLHALAYCDSTRQFLTYSESSDGSTWTAAQDVDRDGVTGYYPSVAFDDSGNPAIAYYRCNDYGAGTGCDTNKDGLYLARRRAGTWDIQKIGGESGIRDGQHTALAFAGGKAVIAFQSSYYDLVAGSSKAILRVAKEP
jgi:hypothetical protein